MHLPIEDLTPRQIVAELGRYIVGQEAAKRAVAVALRNRYRRQQLSEDDRADVMPKNILMIGPTGVGKTEIARRLAQLARAPFIKVEATKFTEVGYVGRDVESMVRDLVSSAMRLVEREKMAEIGPEAEVRALERLVDLLAPRPSFGRFPGVHPMFDEASEGGASPEQAELERDALRARILEGDLDHEVVEIDVEEQGNPFLQVFSSQGIEEMGLEGNFGGPFGSRRTTRRVRVGEARGVLYQEEAKRLLDRLGLHREAIERTEQTGIVFLDEIDKVAVKSSGGAGPDVSREGVQRDLLPIIEGSTVSTKFGPVRTDHILFIAAGAFHMSKPSDLIPELQGRLPIRVQLDSLTVDDFGRILREPKNSLTRQYCLLLKTEGVDVTFTDDALDEIARIAAEVNHKTENIGARRLHTVMERVLEDVLFEAPDGGQKQIRYDAAAVRQRLEASNDADQSRYIL